MAKIKIKFRRGRKSVYINGTKAVPIYNPGTRRVFRVGATRILKLDEPRRGVFRLYGWSGNVSKQSTIESARYKLIKRQDRKYFPKVISSGKGWILMERIIFKTGPKAYRHISIVEDIAHKYDIDDIDACGMSWNWGVCRKTDTPKIFDFAI